MSEIKRPVPMYLLTGFLGAGKTTLLNRLVSLLSGKRLGILVNDFGDMPVDGAFLHREGHVLHVTELNGGQIFCSCLSASFVQSVAAYKDTALDYLFIECSGLAKPTPMTEIMDQAVALSGDAFEYVGMICLIDAESYEDMADVINAVDEQLFFSDCFIINKVDRVEPATVERIKRKIRLYHADAPVFETSFAEVDRSVLDFHSAMQTPPDALRGDWSGWGEKGRPYACSFRAAGVLSEAAVRSFLECLAPDTFRIKGVLRLDSGVCQIDCVGSDLQMKSYPGDVETGGIVVISRIGSAIKPVADSAWLNVLRTAE